MPEQHLLHQWLDRNASGLPVQHGTRPIRHLHEVRKRSVERWRRLTRPSPDGTGAMHQISGCMPMALTFECKAYQCVFPGQQLAPMSIGERFALIAAGVAAALMLVAGVLAVFVRSYKLRQRFTGVETQVVPVTLAWQGLSCHLQLSNGRSLQT